MYHSPAIRPDPEDPALHNTHRWTCDDVVALVAKSRNVPSRILKHESRCRAKAARARQLAMYLSHVGLGLSLTEVGLAFHRDRTTVSYACGLIEDLRDDPAFDDEVAALEAVIEQRREGTHG
jgi:chromosomal replication initiation ATPase DnaA